MDIVKQGVGRYRLKYRDYLIVILFFFHNSVNIRVSYLLMSEKDIKIYQRYLPFLFYDISTIYSF